jgi:hypothetical protein
MFLATVFSMGYDLVAYQLDPLLAFLAAMINDSMQWLILRYFCDST